VSEQDAVEARVAALRRAFDDSFAALPSAAPEGSEDLLLIRIAALPFAMRLRDIRAIVARPAVVPVPSRAPALLGLAGLHGDIVPVFSLCSILGLGSDTGARWVVVCGAEERVGLGFSEFERYVRLPSSAVHSDASASTTKAYVRELAATGDGFRPVVHIDSVLAAILTRRDGARVVTEG
jgi:purine-binding chemotaxis protein CheW